MRDVVIELQGLPARNAPASDDALGSLAETLGYQVPDAVRELYCDHDGLPVGSPLPLRLLSASEARATNAELRDSDLKMDRGIAVFWTDDNSNYAGVFAAGELAGRVCLLDHEEPEDWPKYRTVASFYRELLSAWHAGLGWYEMPNDYPALDHASATAEDRSLGRELLERCQQKPDARAAKRAAFCAMQLLPPADSDLLLPLLRSKDMWIQERACWVLGRHKFAPAIEDLCTVATTGMHNGKQAALVALRNIGTSESKRRFDELRRALGDAFPSYLL